MVLSSETSGTYHIQSNHDHKGSKGMPKESHVLLERKRTEQEYQGVQKIRTATWFRFSHDEPLEATVMERGYKPLQAELQDVASSTTCALGPEEEMLL